jgi:AcrR family transcriptional regulator
MTSPQDPSRQRRNKGFEETHQQLLEAAVRLISEKGIDALSIAGVARAAGIHRTTVYYHFDSREALLEEVKRWSSEQLAKAFQLETPQQERIDYITRFVLGNPELIKLWIEDAVSGDDIRRIYPRWDDLVTGFESLGGKDSSGDPVDEEVFFVMMLVGAFIGPRIFKNAVCPDADLETVVRRFGAEQQRLLRRNGLLNP